MLDENGNVIETDNEEQEQNEEPDYKKLYEEANSKAEKWEGNFKKTAKQLNELKATKVETNPDELFEKKFNEKMFFINNPVAKEFEKEIKELQSSNGLGTEDAYTLFLAKNKPELIGKKSDIGVDGVALGVEQKKNYNEMSYEELRNK